LPPVQGEPEASPAVEIVAETFESPTEVSLSLEDSVIAPVSVACPSHSRSISPVPEPRKASPLPAVSPPSPIIAPLSPVVSGEESHFPPGTLVAVLCRVEEDSASEDWMLATVERFLPDERVFEVEDCEVAEGDEGEVIPSGGQGRRRKVELARVLRLPQSNEDALAGEDLKAKTPVLALFAGTTCLYPAQVVSGPLRRKKTRDYLVSFQDDEVASRPCYARYVIPTPSIVV